MLDVFQLQEKDSDYDEMEQWLATNKPQVIYAS